MKANYGEISRAGKELRNMPNMAVNLIADWFYRYKDKTSLESLARILLNWRDLGPTTPAEEIREALCKLMEKTAK